MSAPAAEMASDTLLDIRNLTVALPPEADRAHAVDGISLTLSRGEVLCIVGESGSGKSITAHAVMGLLPEPHVRIVDGEIVFEGQTITRLDRAVWRDLRGRRMGMIFQEPMTALNPVMRIGAQVEEVLRAHTEMSAAQRQSRVVELLDAVGLPDPEHLGEVYPFRLSGGQRQRVMIAGALALEPALLIADEPTTALDVTTQMQILKLIKELQGKMDMGVLFITHDFGVVTEVADRVAVMQEGHVVELGTLRQVLDSPQHDYTKKLIAAVPKLREDAADHSAEKVVLSTREVCKTFSQSGGFLTQRRVVNAVKNVDLEIRASETLGLVGESGSGKSTFARCLVRLVDADSGEIWFAGHNLVPLSSRSIRPLRPRIQMIFQDPYASLNPRRKVGRIIAEGPIAQGTPARTAMERARELLTLVGLDKAVADRYPHEFSGGQRQRIGIARALALEPDVLVADEPVSALDVSVQAQILELLAELKQRLNLALVFITHDLRVAAQVCDTIAVMRLGEIVEIGPKAEVFRTPKHEYTRALLDAIPGKRLLLE